MRHKVLALVLALVMTVPTSALPASANGCSLDGIEGNNGTLGSSLNPYEIASAEDLVGIVACSGVSSHFEITRSIDLGGDETDPLSAWTPLASVGSPFSGVIDGGEKVISGLYLTGDADNQGLFAAVSDFEISNLSLEGIADVAGENVGLLSGAATGNFTAVNVDISGSVAGAGVVGLLLGGWAEYGANSKSLLVTGSDIRGDLTSYYYAGGIIGWVDSSTGNTYEINNSRVDLRFSPFEDYPVDSLGGLIGYSYSRDGVISTSDVVVDFDISDIAGSNPALNIGGLVGLNEELLVVHSVSVAGNIVDPDVRASRVGGLIGWQSNADLTLTNSQFSGVVQAYEYVGGLIGADTGFAQSSSSTDVAISGAKVFGQVIGRDQVGGLIGQTGTLKNSTFLLEDSVNYADVTSAIFPDDPGYPLIPDYGALGGLIGYGYADINAISSAEAVVANRTDVTIRRSANFGSIRAGGEFAGGLVGVLQSVAADVNVENSANYGSVTALQYAGGLLGSASLSRRVYSGTAYPLPAKLTLSQSFSAAPSVTTLGDSYSPKGVIGNLYVDEDPGSPAEFVLTQNSSTNSVLWDSELSGVSQDVAKAQSPSMGTEARTTAEMVRIADYVASGYDITLGWRGAPELILLPPISLTSFTPMSAYTTWGACPEFNGGYPFLNDLYLEDVCTGSFVVSEPTIETLTSRWSEQVWASCESFEDGRQYLSFAYEIDPCLVVDQETQDSGVATAAPYLGPVIIVPTGLEPLSPGQLVQFEGSNLKSITEITLGGKDAKVNVISDSLLGITVPELEAGDYNLMVTSSFGQLSVFPEVRVGGVVAQEQNLEVIVKRISDTEAKVWAKNVVSAGKVQFLVNGREIAWIRAADNTDPKLRFANNAYYLVRTINLAQGKNALEIFVDGERVRRVAYTLK